MISGPTHPVFGAERVKIVEIEGFVGDDVFLVRILEQLALCVRLNGGSFWLRDDIVMEDPGRIWHLGGRQCVLIVIIKRFINYLLHIYTI